MEVNLIEKSLELMIVGMGMTFLFLILLVCSMGLLKKTVEFLNKRFPEEAPKTAPAPQAQNNTAIAIAIAAARNFAK